MMLWTPIVDFNIHPDKQKTLKLNQCWFNAGPATLAQH